MIDYCVVILINLYNPKTKKEQVSTWRNLNLMLQTFDDLENKIIILGGDFNLFLDSALEAEGGSPVLKKSSVSKLIEIKEKYNLCDIWRIRNTKEKRFTFRQKHRSGFLQRRLDYFFVSNTLQESIKDTEILPALSSDHSPIFFSLVSTKPASKGKGLWKFNNSLLLNEEFVTKMRNYIHLKINEMNHENINDDQIR